MRSWVKISSITIGLSLLLAALACFYAIWKTKREAEQFFKDSQALEVGKATAQDISLFYNMYHDHASWSGLSLSNGGPGLATINFENTWMYRLHLAPRMVFSCRLTIKDQKLDYREFLMAVVKKGYDQGTFVRESKTTTWRAELLHRPEEQFFRIVGDRPTGYFGVLITPTTPVDLRRLAYNFDFNCFVKIGGCKSYEEMLPVLMRTDLYWGQDPWVHD